MEKIIYLKQELNWHIVSNYLEAISSLSITYKDKTFEKLFKEMQNYVDGKITLENDGEVVDAYVVVLQKSEN